MVLQRAGHAGCLLKFLHGQRSALQLPPAAAAEPRAQRDAAGDPLHPGASAPSAAAGSHQTQRCPEVHAGPVQYHLYRPRTTRIFVLQTRFTDPGFPHGDPAGKPLPR